MTTPIPEAPAVCDLRAASVYALGDPCAACGHTTLAHPGPANPALTSCALCSVLATNYAQRVELAQLAGVVEQLAAELELVRAGGVS